MDRSAMQTWLDAYVAAWKSYDAAAIGDLFAVAAEYRYHPLDEPVRGRDQIVASWLAKPDAAGRYDAQYAPSLVEGDLVLATGWSRYFDESGELEDEYANAFLVRFDGEGRCMAFTEWYTRSRRFAKAAAGAPDA